jgi:hypothetical protein
MLSIAHRDRLETESRRLRGGIRRLTPTSLAISVVVSALRGRADVSASVRLPCFAGESRLGALLYFYSRLFGGWLVGLRRPRRPVGITAWHMRRPLRFWGGRIRSYASCGRRCRPHRGGEWSGCRAHRRRVTLCVCRQQSLNVRCIDGRSSSKKSGSSSALLMSPVASNATRTRGVLRRPLPRSRRRSRPRGRLNVPPKTDQDMAAGYRAQAEECRQQAAKAATQLLRDRWLKYADESRRAPSRPPIARQKISRR